jgi:hypothetical protein
MRMVRSQRLICVVHPPDRQPQSSSSAVVTLIRRIRLFRDHPEEPLFCGRSVAESYIESESPFLDSATAASGIMAGHSKWKQIKHYKAATDAKRGALFTKLIREITISAKQAGWKCPPADGNRDRARELDAEREHRTRHQEGNG